MQLEAKDALKIVQTHPVSVVTTVNEEKVANAATFSWLCPVSKDPPIVSIMVSPERYTFENLQKGSDFVINVVTKHSLEETVYVGRESFHDEPDKIEKSDFSTAKSNDIDPPRLKEAIAWVECKTQDMIKAGDHYIVTGKVITGQVTDDFWNDRLLSEDAETVHHFGGNKFLIAGDVVKIKI